MRPTSESFARNCNHGVRAIVRRAWGATVLRGLTAPQMAAGVSKDAVNVSSASSGPGLRGEVALRGQVVTSRQHKVMLKCFDVWVTFFKSQLSRYSGQSCSSTLPVKYPSHDARADLHARSQCALGCRSLSVNLISEWPTSFLQFIQLLSMGMLVLALSGFSYAMVFKTVCCHHNISSLAPSSCLRCVTSVAPEMLLLITLPPTAYKVLRLGVARKVNLICRLNWLLVQTSARLLFQHPHVQGVNICFACINLFTLGSLLLMFSYNMVLAHCAKLHWSAFLSLMH